MFSIKGYLLKIFMWRDKKACLSVWRTIVEAGSGSPVQGCRWQRQGWPRPEQSLEGAEEGSPRKSTKHESMNLEEVGGLGRKEVGRNL